MNCNGGFFFHCIFFFLTVQDGEQWKSKCVTHTCDKGRVITEYVSCKKLTKPSCENELPPVRIYDEGGCCFHYECRGVLELKCFVLFCFLKMRLKQLKKSPFEITFGPVLAGTCAVWGNPHYFTFDNHHYAFQENCTFVLVKEIVKRHNFTVHINNVLCDSSSIAVCSRSLFVYYKNYKVVLSVKKLPKLKTKVPRGKVWLICKAALTLSLTLMKPCICQGAGQRPEGDSCLLK